MVASHTPAPLQVASGEVVLVHGCPWGSQLCSRHAPDVLVGKVRRKQGW